MHRAQQRSQINTTSKYSSRAGFTLLELIFTLSIFSVIMLSIGTFFNSTAKSTAEHTIRSQLGVRGQLTLDRVVEDLMEASLSSLEPLAPAAATSLSFQKVIGVADGFPVLADPVHIDFLAGPNVVRRWINHAPFGFSPGPEDEVAVLETKMATNGLRFTRDGNVVYVDLDMEATSQGELYEFQLSSAVKLRNVN